MSPSEEPFLTRLLLALVGKQIIFLTQPSTLLSGPSLAGRPFQEAISSKVMVDQHHMVTFEETNGVIPPYDGTTPY